MPTYTVHDITQQVGGTLSGDATIEITGVEEIALAQQGQLTFIGEKKYLKFWETSRASAVIINDSYTLVPQDGQAIIRVPNADLAFARVLQLFDPGYPQRAPGIHPAAVVDSTAMIGENVSIGAGCVIGPRVAIGANTRLYANVTIFDDSVIGNDTVIWSGTVIRERCRVGSHCILHPNVTIGADGFGYRPSEDGRSLVKIPQIGTVIIGNHVEIGANSCVDRGKFSATSIGDGTKLDNLVQIAHNCKVGRSCIMAGMSGLSGSVTLGDGVIIGGSVSIKDHVTIGDGVQVAGKSGVIADVAPGVTVAGFPAEEHKKMLRQWAALRQLPDLLKRLKKSTLS